MQETKRSRMRFCLAAGLIIALLGTACLSGTAQALSLSLPFTAPQLFQAELSKEYKYNQKLEMDDFFVELTWLTNGYSDVEFSIYRDGKLLGSTKRTSFKDTELFSSGDFQFNRNYTYKVVAENYDGQVRSATVNFSLRDVKKPSFPGTLNAVSKYDGEKLKSVDLRWPEAHDDTVIVCYELYRNGELIEETLERKYTDTITENVSGTIKYEVVAIDLAGKKATRSLTVSSKKISVEIPAKKDDLSAKIGQSLKNSWRKLTSSSALSLSAVLDFQSIPRLNLLSQWADLGKLKLSAGRISLTPVFVLPSLHLANPTLDFNKSMSLNKGWSSLNFRAPNLVFDNSRYNVIY
jgi:hypothetical protein